MSSTAPPPPGQGQIVVRTRLFFLSFLLYFWKPFLQIDDGAPAKVRWGRTTVPVEAGRHRLRCYVAYPYSATLGDSTTDVDVAGGETVNVQWRSPYLIFLRGTWKHSR